MYTFILRHMQGNLLMGRPAAFASVSDNRILNLYLD